MAIQYLNNIDLNKNELQNGVIHKLATPPSNPVEGQLYYNSTDSRLYFYDGTIWVDASGDIKSVVTSTATTLDITDPNGPNPSLAIVTAAVTNGGTALATGDQIYDYVTGAIGNISVSIAGTTNEVEVTTTNGLGTFGNGDSITVGLPNDVTIGNNLTVTNDLGVTGSAVITGNLTVNGTTTTVNSTTVDIGDNIILLNSGETAAPTQDAGIEIKRGTSPNRSLIWDESAGVWTIQQNTGTYERISTYADSIEDVTVTSSAGSGLTITETLSGTDNRVKTYDAALNFSDFTFKTSIGDGVTLSYPVNHNLGSQDVIVQLYDVSSFETVYADVIRNTINQITIAFATAPSSNDIRVLIQKL